MAPRLARVSQVAARLRGIVDGYGSAHALSDLHVSGRRLGAITPGPNAPYDSVMEVAEKARNRLCPPVDRTCRAYVTLDAFLGNATAAAQILCLGLDLRPLGAEKSGIQSATSASVQSVGPVHVCGLANFKGQPNIV